MQSNPKHVEKMFDDIAPVYDKLNHVLTFHIDKIWRKKLVKQIQSFDNQLILDIATGTGDLAFDILKRKKAFIHGIDISEKMVTLCNKKIDKKKVSHLFQCTRADAMHMQFDDLTFHTVTIGFGIRNFEHTENAISEIHRVLKKNGQLLILEFFRSRLVEKNRLYRFYMKRIMPLIGKLISRHPWAYVYLFNSIENFLSENEFITMLDKNGFYDVKKKKLMGGMAFIISAVKR